MIIHVTLITSLYNLIMIVNLVQQIDFHLHSIRIYLTMKIYFICNFSIDTH